MMILRENRALPNNERKFSRLKNRTKLLSVITESIIEVGIARVCIMFVFSPLCRALPHIILVHSR